MSRIKIISNPYKKEIQFQKYNINDEMWIDINIESNPNSKLLKSEISSGFFPFKAKKIVEILLEEYESDNELLELVFEGSLDEFAELSDVCSCELYKDKITIEQSPISLANARDILPEVKRLFQEMSPLIVQSVSQEKIQRDLSRFSDASSDVVPICVLGNYSAGKSTFINALIGCEILPSGTEPVTAKVYKITRSKYSDRANIKFSISDFEISILFTENDTIFEKIEMESDLSINLKTELSEMNSCSMGERVNRSLSLINDYENETEDAEISDLIQVEIPFSNGVLGKSQHPFVIFDTPGSNSASNAKHLQVLKEAMANMTNGLPVFLSTPDSLDSTDNENLYKIIREMDELDSRFTMIVVNKADSASVQKRTNSEIEQKRILSQAVPRNLYSGGLFYVSSIIGLGSKTDGTFMDEIYDDIYDAQVDRYENPDNKRYRELYLYNIQPEQLKRKSDLKASQQSDLIYANSGLFTIESEIEAFAGKYAAYNKCFQSQMFLGNVIKITGEEITTKKEQNEEIRENIKEKLESDKKVLTDKIDVTSKEKQNQYVAGYAAFMTDTLEESKDTFSVQLLKAQFDEFVNKHETELKYSEHTDAAKSALDSIGENLKNNMSNVFKKTGSATLKGTFGNLKSDIKNTVDSYQTQNNTRHQVNKKASESLLKFVSGMYEQKLSDIYSKLDTQSKKYWSNNTENLRKTLVEIVTGSEVLTENRREELSKIIITYRKLSFEEGTAETIFDKVNFERKIKIGEHVIWESDHLKIDKLSKTYNASIEKGAQERYSSIEESHRDSAFSWVRSLLDEIYENIVEYSPELSKQAKQIKLMTEQIKELEERKAKLKDYTNKLGNMMEWKDLNANREVL